MLSRMSGYIVPCARNEIPSSFEASSANTLINSADYPQEIPRQPLFHISPNGHAIINVNNVSSQISVDFKLS